MKKTLQKVLGDPQTKKLKKLNKRIVEINDLSDKFKKLSDKQLQAKTDEFKKQLKDGKSLDDILPEAFATVREAADRILGERHYDVQLVGGMVLHEGSVAEMRTGEGKTLVATLPVYLNALSGKGVHVVTVNDYLAQRDAGWMGQVYHFLGLSTAVIIADHTFMYDSEIVNEEHDDERMQHLREVTRPEGYSADITYGTNNEFGFDYLRDNMVSRVEDLRQRELNFAIVDEVDSILIDEARTPLIISAPASSSGSSYSLFAQIARRLKPEHYELDEKRRSVALNDEGVEKVQEWLDVDNLYSPENVRNIYHLDQALRAETLFKKDKDYVVSEDGDVIIVDEFTGRLMHGRRYNEGLHQAIEAKEGVEVLQESMTLATISFQNYFRLYAKLSGMTGTAKTEEEEFQQIYDLDVIEIPTNKPIARVDHNDKIYKSQKGKFNSIVSIVKEINEIGQPILIGTASIEKNELLSHLLSKAGVEHNVLNAKNNEGEAAIVAKAGQKGAVTLATNIAGRGTDIKLSEEVKKLGGLYVIGSERHEARRIDNQLRGRAGRQGDPGTTQFFVAADDDLMRIFGGDRIAGIMNRLGVDDETPIENRSLSKALENAQKKVESQNFDSRKHVVQYDDVMNRHRKATYTLRRKILESESVENEVKKYIENQIDKFQPKEGEKPEKIIDELKAIIPLTDEEVKKLAKSRTGYKKSATELAEKKYQQQEKVFTKDIMRQIEREVHLQILDTLWMQHLENMQHLREGITWRSVGQKDPLVEYRREGQLYYEDLQDNMSTEIVRALYHAHPPEPEQVEEPVETELTKAAEHSIANDTSPGKSTGKKKSMESGSSKRAASEEISQKSKKDTARRKKKQQRKNRKKNRRK